MNQDTLHSILIHVDVDSIPNMYLVNKMILQVCKPYNFWHQYFIKNNLTMLYKYNCVGDWVKSVQAHIQTNNYINMLKDKYTDFLEVSNINSRLPVTKDLKKLFVPQYDNIDISMSHIPGYDNSYLLEYTVHNVTRYLCKHIDRDLLYTFVYHLIYYNLASIRYLDNNKY
jgi:hypothetical protein